MGWKGWSLHPCLCLGTTMVASCSCCFSAKIMLLQISLSLTNSLRDPHAVEDAHAFCRLVRTVGATIQLPLSTHLSPAIREIEWSWVPQGKNKTEQLLVTWRPRDSVAANWYQLDQNFKSQLQLNATLLRIENATMDMRGVYRAKIKFESGKLEEEAFRLCLYEPIPHAQIQVQSLSNTWEWCNVSLQCGSPGTTGNLTVDWLSEDLPGEPMPRGPLWPAPGSKTLSLSLLRDQSHGHLTCTVRNPADQKNTTLHMSSICSWSSSLKSSLSLLFLFLVLLTGFLGVGVWIWMRKKRKTRKGGAARPAAAALQALDTEEGDDPLGPGPGSPALCYADPSFLRPPKKDWEQGGSHPHCTIYDNLTSPGPRGSR